MAQNDGEAPISLKVADVQKGPRQSVSPWSANGVVNVRYRFGVPPF